MFREYLVRQRMEIVYGVSPESILLTYYEHFGNFIFRSMIYIYDDLRFNTLFLSMDLPIN